jgi:cell division protein FtsL
MGTFEKHKKEMENRIDNLTETQYHQQKSLDKVSKKLFWVIVTVVSMLVTLLMIWFSYITHI